MNTVISKEQFAEWDKVTGPGLYRVQGDVAYAYLCQRIKWIVGDKSDPHTILLIGSDDERSSFMKKMYEVGAIDFPNVQPEFFWHSDYAPEEGGELIPRNLNSEVDTEDFCNFIRHAPKNEFYPVAAVIILFEPFDEFKYIDKLLKIPVWRGSTLEKNIELPVFNVGHSSGYNEFSKQSKPSPSGVTRTIELLRGDEIKPEVIEWLVPEFVPLHQATAFSGEMDTRKSTVALDIAAKGSLFGEWFTGNGSNHTPFITLVAAAEDIYSTTVVPRFLAAGGNPDCLYCMKLDVKCEQTTADGLQIHTTPLSFDAHLNELADTIRDVNRSREWKVGLLVFDPIIAFFGNKNYNNPQDARDIMVGLKKLCEELKVTIINICHFNKTIGLTAKQKTAGSKALIEAHRQAWAFDLMEDDKTTTLIAPIKANLMAKAKSYKITTDSKEINLPEDEKGFYQKASVGVVRFVGYSEMSADDRIEEKESKDRGNRKEVRKAILDTLKDGPMPAGQVCNTLQDMGVSARTIRRAAESLVDEGKVKRVGTNPKNFVWQLATEAEQVHIFDEATK